MFDLTNTIYENEGWENYRQMLLNSYPQRMLKKTLTMPLNNTLHLHKQLLLLLSKLTLPLEGFDADALDEILGLRAKGLRSCVMLPVGYRDSENDWLVNLTKVRKSKEDLVTLID
jgi:hypothetical protein